MVRQQFELTVLKRQTLRRAKSTNHEKVFFLTLASPSGVKLQLRLLVIVGDIVLRRHTLVVARSLLKATESDT